MAKKRANKNRSYREMTRRLMEKEALIEKQRRKGLEHTMSFLMLAFSIITILLVVFSALKAIGQEFLFIFAIAEIILVFCCFVCHIKEPDKAIKRMGIVMVVCASASITAALLR